MSFQLRLIVARIQSGTQIEVGFTPHKTSLAEDVFEIPGLKILSIRRYGDDYMLETTQIDIQKTYRVHVHSVGEKTIIAGNILNDYVSSKPLGCLTRQKRTTFRLFAPQAKTVQVVLFDRRENKQGKIFEMARDDDGVWESTVLESCIGKYYVYRLNGRQSTSFEKFSEMDIADPYSRSVARLNHYLYPSRTHIPDPEAKHFDWEGDTWITPDLKDLIIYEMHVRDMTIHAGSEISPDKRGTYAGLTESGKTGGLDYIRSLGVNAVELLPVQEFANIEVPYRDLSVPVWNTWNPYARNHWGYMTSFYFAPAAYYAAGGTVRPGAVCGGENHIITEFKEMVKCFHKAGIAVILDVVYNHVSQYDLNPLKQIDRDYYFRLNQDGSYLSKSYCGNDFYTERPMARRLITDSLVYWMKEFHIDGFRFDLAGLMDEDTLDAITAKTRNVNPEVILIAEPWGGDEYGQYRYSRRGWAAWNDQFRNGVKGQNPVNGRSFIFESLYGDTHAYTLMKRLISGSTQAYGGPYCTAQTSVNYLESHDEWTLGDFIRISTGEVSVETRVENMEQHVQLTPIQKKIQALAAVILFTSQGPVMLHAGQEFAKSQVIEKSREVEDPDSGLIDHNSYNKDNITNHLVYEHAEKNNWLIDYYRGLIQLRNTYAQFRQTHHEALHFMHGSNPFSLGYLIKGEKPVSDPSFLVLLNASKNNRSVFYLPEGRWSMIVSPHRSGTIPFSENLTGRFELETIMAVVLVKQSQTQ